MTTQPHGRPADEIEVDWSWTSSDDGWVPPEIDASRPSAARMYDYAIGGKDNYEVDRRAVHQIAGPVPDFRECAQANRAFLVRAVHALAELGIDQFIDLGSGIPTSPNVHQVAQQSRPAARVVYVDNDPIVTTYNRALRESGPGVLALSHDLRRPHSLIDDVQLREHLDLDRPVGLLMVAVLHFVRHEAAVKVLEQYRRLLPEGSFLVVSVVCSDGTGPGATERLEQVFADSATPFVKRSAAQVEQLFDSLELLEPGLVDVTQWRHDGRPLSVRMLGAVARLN